MPDTGFVHLHLHTQYSLLDGAITIENLVARVKEYRMPAVAMTDHGNLFGAIDFYQQAVRNGIKPIVGCEVYIQSDGSRFEKKLRRGHEPYHHLVLLAIDREGYQNLCKLVTAGHLEGFYYKPRIDKAILREFSKGLIVLSGCLSGEMAEVALAQGVTGARRVAEEFLEIFGDRFYLEVQGNSLPDQRRFNQVLTELSQTLSIPLVATNDCHYLRREDAAAHEALLCIQTGKTLQEEDRMRFSSDEFYLRSPEEMKEIFREIPAAIATTSEIASRIDLTMDFKTYTFPKYQSPDGKKIDNYDDYLEQEVWRGFEERWGFLATTIVERGEDAGLIRKKYEERLKHELQRIRQMGFSGYFLIVADFINYAKGQNIPVGPGRGSAAGSLVAYCLKITDLDPIPYNLLFERFLNPERVSMPDMDIDFCMNRRDEVIRYVQQKYGNVGQIITFGKMKAKAVVRDVGRVMNIPYKEVDRIAKLIPNTLNITLDEACRSEVRLRELEERDPTVKKLLAIARSLEGLNRHASTHAAGVVISDQPLVNFVPLSRGQNDEIVTQYDMKSIEKIGLIKFDFLGLKTLTVIDQALKIVKRTHNREIQINEIPLDDPDVYRNLATGDTTGIFQLESSGMRDLIVKMKPSLFPDLIALVALYRPGPLGSGMVDEFINRKHGRVQVRYELPELESILKETHGVIVYQEQVMQIASTLADFSLGDADILRRAMGKKKPEEMAEQRDKFLKGCQDKKIPPRKAEKIFDQMAKFAEYGFNKCVVAETELLDVATGATFTVRDLLCQGADRSVLACDSSYRLVPRKILSVTSNGRKRIFALRTALGHRIRVTSNHPFLTVGGWRELRELKKGDRIAVPRVLPVEGTDRWPSHEVITLAWLLSEGNTCHPSSLYFYNNERSIVDDFSEAVSQFPHTRARLSIRSDGRLEVCVNTGSRSHIPWNARDMAALIEEKPARSGAYRWAERLNLIGKKARDKTIPPGVFRLNNNQVALFLGRLWSGDGFIFGPNNTVPFYATSSPKMAKQVQQLLLRFALPSRIAEKKFRYRGGFKNGFEVFLTGDESSRVFLEKIGPHLVGREENLKGLQTYLRTISMGLSSRDTVPSEVKKLVREEKEGQNTTWLEIEEGAGLSMKEFYGGRYPHKRGFRRETIFRLGRHLHSQTLQNLGTSDLYWDEIDEISEEGIDETFDLTIERDHNFVADGIIVHNSHSAAYAFISYQTAWLKTHFPVEYTASLLTHEMGNADKMIPYLQDAREHGIVVQPPDINESFSGFAVTGERTIRFGLAAVKNVGEAAIDSIVEARKRAGEKGFRSFAHFCEEIDARKVNRRVLEGLIKCGAFDSMKISRSVAFQQIDRATERAAKVQKERESGQANLFGSGGGEGGGTGDQMSPDQPEWSQRERLAFEKESIGFYMTGHPLDDCQEVLKSRTNADTTSIRSSETDRDGKEVCFGGVVSSLREVITKNGDRMGFVTVEDLKGTVSVIVFPDLYRQVHRILTGDEPILIRGTVQAEEDAIRVIAKEVVPIGSVEKKILPREIHFQLTGDRIGPVTKERLEALKSLLRHHQGSVPAYIHLPGHVLSLPEGLKVDPSSDLVQEVDQLFGSPVTVLQ